MIKKWKIIRDGKRNKSYWDKEIDNDKVQSRTLVKIGNILLCLDTSGSYYITPEEFEEDFEERKKNNEKLENFLYFKVDSLTEEEFFKLFMEMKQHDISEVKDVVSDRTEENIRKTADEIEAGSRQDKQSNKFEIDKKERND